MLSQIFRYLRIEPTTDASYDDYELTEDVGEGDTSGASAAYESQVVSKPKHEEKISQPAQTDAPEGTAVVPNFKRKSIREVARIASEIGLSLDSSGSGFASYQSIAPGEIVDKGTKIYVEFTP